MSKAANTRNFIVEKTAPIFNMKGYAGTSLSDLTEATGLTKGSIYGNFANKDEVALAVFDYNLVKLNAGVSAAIAGSTSAIEALLKMANFYRSKFKALVTAGGCPIMNTIVEADDTHPQLKEKASQGIKAWKVSIESIITQGIKSKEIRKTVNASDFATGYIALIEGGILLARATGNVGMLNTCIDRVEAMINYELAT